MSVYIILFDNLHIANILLSISVEKFARYSKIRLEKKRKLDDRKNKNHLKTIESALVYQKNVTVI